MKKIWLKGTPKKGRRVELILNTNFSVIGYYGGYDKYNNEYIIYQAKKSWTDGLSDTYERPIYVRKDNVWFGTELKRC